MILSRGCRGLRPCVESVPEPEDSSAVLKWILGYFWSLPRGVSPRLEWGHARALSFRAVAPASRSLRVDQGICGFPSRLSHKAFPQGCPTCHRVVSLSLARKSRQCRENRFPWNGLRHLGDSGNGGTTRSSSRLSCGERLLLRCDGNAVNSFPTRRVSIPPLELCGGNGAPLDVGGTLVLPFEWRRVCRGTS